MYRWRKCLQEKWTDLVEEHEKDVLNWAACVNKDFLVLCYLHDVKVERGSCTYDTYTERVVFLN